MKVRTLTTLAAAVAVIAAFAMATNGVDAGNGPQIAEMSLADTIAKRQQMMKDTGASMKAISEFVESGTGTAEDVGKRAGAMKEFSGGIADLFPAGTSIDDDVAKTAAKKDIWDSFEEFKAGATKMGELAAGLQEAAGTGDQQKIADAFNMLGKEGCGGCHSKFRLKTP